MTQSARFANASFAIAPLDFTDIRDGLVTIISYKMQTAATTIPAINQQDGRSLGVKAYRMGGSIGNRTMTTIGRVSSKKSIPSLTKYLVRNQQKIMVIKRFGIDFDSSGGALTLDPAYVSTDGTEGSYPCGIHSRSHDNGWTISGKIHEEYYYWVNEFQAKHPKYGKVWGDFEKEVFADSEEGFQDFYKNFPPEAWDYSEI